MSSIASHVAEIINFRSELPPSLTRYLRWVVASSLTIFKIALKLLWNFSIPLMHLSRDSIFFAANSITSWRTLLQVFYKLSRKSRAPVPLSLRVCSSNLRESSASVHLIFGSSQSCAGFPLASFFCVLGLSMEIIALDSAPRRLKPLQFLKLLFFGES